MRRGIGRGFCFLRVRGADRGILGENIVILASFSKLADGGTTGVGKPENLGGFVEGFADGVIESGADDLKIGMGSLVNELGVAARYDKGKGGEGGGIWAIKPVGVDVGFDMMNGIEGFLMCEGECAGGESADKKRAIEAGSVGDGDGVNLIYGESGIFEGLVDDGVDGLDVGAGGEFRDDAAVFAHQIGGRGNDVAFDGAAICYDGSASVVAGGFDTENIHECIVTVLTFGVKCAIMRIGYL